LNAAKGMATASDLDAASVEKHPIVRWIHELCVLADKSKQQPKKHTASFVTKLMSQPKHLPRHVCPWQA